MQMKTTLEVKELLTVSLEISDNDTNAVQKIDVCSELIQDCLGVNTPLYAGISRAVIVLLLQEFR